MRMLRWLHVELADSWSAAAIQEKMVPPKVIIEEMVYDVPPQCLRS